MVLPAAVDTQIFARVALAGKPASLQQANRGGIGGDARGLYAVQPQRAECERQQRTYRSAHVAAARIGLSDPISEAPGLRDAAAHVRQSQSAQQRLIGTAEDEEGIGLVGALVLGIAAQSASERSAGEIVGGPGRLPWREERPARVAPRRPFGGIAGTGRPQHDAPALH